MTVLYSDFDNIEVLDQDIMVMSIHKMTPTCNNELIVLFYAKLLN